MISLNREKYGPQKLQIRTLFTQYILLQWKEKKEIKQSLQDYFQFVLIPKSNHKLTKSVKDTL